MPEPTPTPTDLAGWTPPPDFMAVESRLEGVTVFAPRPAGVPEEEPTTYKCPNCGATTKYDVAAGGVTCEHCGFARAVQAAPSHNASPEEFTLENLRESEKGWGVDRRALHCDSCGGEVFVSEGALTATCPFCASNGVNIIAGAADNLRPRFLIPFKVKPETTRSLAKEWLGKGWFHPSELTTSSVVDRFQGIYVSYWVFDANIHSAWEAEVGYERQERYYDASDKTWKTRTVIDWRWEHGQVSVSVRDLLISGTAKLSRILLGRLLPYQMSELAAYTPDFLAGWQAQTYDIHLKQAWETGKAVMRERAKDACYDDIPTPHVRNFSMTADFADETWRYALLPVYVAAYRFGEKTYQVMVNGQTGKVSGQKPVAWWKVWTAIGLALAPGVFLGILGLILSIFGIGLLLLPVGVILFVIGVIIAVIFYRQAASSEAA